MVVNFSCSCGNALRTSEDNSGLRLKCPRCGNSCAIPSSKSGGPAGTFFASTLVRQEGGWIGPSSQPTALGTRPPLKLLLLRTVIAFLVIGVIVGLVAAYMLWFRKKPKEVEHADAIPRDAMAFASIRVADTWSAAEAQRLDGKLKEMGLERGLEQNFGLPPQDIERLTFVARSEEQKIPDCVVTSTKQIESEEKFVRKLFHSWRGEQETRWYRGKVYHTVCGGNNLPAVYFVNDRTFILAGESNLKWMIDGLIKPTRNQVMQEGIERLAQKDHMVLAVHVSPEMRQAVPKEQQKGALSLQSGIVTGNMQEKNVALKLDAEYETPEKAKEAHQELNSLRQRTKGVGGFIVPFVAKELGLPAELTPSILEALHNLQAEQEKNSIHATTKVNANKLPDVLKWIMQRQKFPLAALQQDNSDPVLNPIELLPRR